IDAAPDYIDYHRVMSSPIPHVKGDGTDAALGLHPIAGRIDAAPSDLQAAISKWERHMQIRGLADKTVQAYVGVVRAAALELGWSSPADITHDAVTEYMAAKRSKDWKGTTYNRNLCAFRGISKYLLKQKLIDEDQIKHADRAKDDADEGSRAATTDEARLMIRTAWARGLVDRRARLMALRVGEAAKLQWRHLLLDEPVPAVRWTKDINKNRRVQEIALAPELVPLLLEHRQAMRTWAIELEVYQAPKRRGEQPAPRKISPDDPQAFVFPMVQGKGTWDEDAVQSGIPKRDHRDRSFSPHSARKWFSTTLTLAGINQGVIDALMRHHRTTSGTYQDLPRMAEVMAILPRLWPVPVAGGRPVDNLTTGLQSVKTSTMDLTSGRGIVEDVPATPGRNSSSSHPPVPLAPGVATKTGWARGSLDDGRDTEISAAFLGPGQPVMPRGGLVNEDSRPEGASEQDLAMADLLESVARLLRSRGHDRSAKVG
ncbi:MAG: hypothetical protein EBZ59_07270, partial [Planctomycetia bacterium]|nr:hypothetical protein [Planctomycetia bacterium]